MLAKNWNTASPAARQSTDMSAVSDRDFSGRGSGMDSSRAAAGAAGSPQRNGLMRLSYCFSGRGGAAK
jgi:hypothetical protein